MNKSTKHFSKNINNFTNRPSKLCSSFSISEKIHNIAIKLSDDEDITNLMLIAADIRKHGFGVGAVKNIGVKVKPLVIGSLFKRHFMIVILILYFFQ